MIINVISPIESIPVFYIPDIDNKKARLIIITHYKYKTARSFYLLKLLVIKQLTIAILIITSIWDYYSNIKKELTFVFTVFVYPQIIAIFEKTFTIIHYE